VDPTLDFVTGPYTARERRALSRALAAGEAPPCPACDTALDVRPVDPPAEVAYVRRRVWVLCPGCGRTAAVDIRP
jgi:hypothetical protein